MPTPELEATVTIRITALARRYLDAVAEASGTSLSIVARAALEHGILHKRLEAFREAFPGPMAVAEHYVARWKQGLETWLPDKHVGWFPNLHAFMDLLERADLMATACHRGELETQAP